MAVKPQRRVKIVHRTAGEMPVTENFAKMALAYNHIKTGGAYCATNEVSRYFEILPDKVFESTWHDDEPEATDPADPIPEKVSPKKAIQEPVAPPPIEIEEEPIPKKTTTTKSKKGRSVKRPPAKEE